MYKSRTKLVIIKQVGREVYRVTKGRDGRFWLMQYDHAKHTWTRRRWATQAVIDTLGINLQLEPKEAA